jgi:hypothetical protein
MKKDHAKTTNPLLYRFLDKKITETPKKDLPQSQNICIINLSDVAGWSSLVARQAHNLKVVGSNPAPATNYLVSKKIPHILSDAHKHDTALS